MTASQNRNRDSLIIFLGATLILAVVYIVVALYCPIRTDSGVFMYSGRVILEGGAPYLDSWDHKGPLLYLLNALGLYLFKGSPRGVYIVEGALLILSLGYISMQWSKLLPSKYVILIASLFASSYFLVFQNGNLTETWLLPFSVVSLNYFLFSEITKDIKDGQLFCFWSGITIAVASLTRINNGLGIFLLLVIFIINKKNKFKNFSFVSFGFLLLTVPILSWIFIKGYFGDFIEQYWFYNIQYSSQTSFFDKINTTSLIINYSFILPTFLFLIFLITAFFIKNKTKKNETILIFLIFAVFFVELMSMSLSGRFRRHYIVNLLPSILALNFLILFFLKKHIFTGSFKHIIVLMFFFVLIIPFQSYENEYFSVKNNFSDTGQRYLSDFVINSPKLVITTPDSCGIGGKKCNPEIPILTKMDTILNEKYRYDHQFMGYKFFVMNKIQR